MKKIVFLAFIIGFQLISSSEQAWSQPAKVEGFPNNKLSSGSIDSQFVQLQNISKTVDQHKLIRRANLEQVRKNVSDSLAQYKKNLQEIRSESENQTKELQVLQDSVSRLQASVKNYQGLENKISFLGISMGKDFFEGLFIGTTLALLIVIFALTQQLKKNKTTARESKTRVDEIQEAFDAHRKKALEKEQKLMRQLQDEINKKGGY